MYTPPKLPSSTVLAALDWQDTPEFWNSLKSHASEMNQSQRQTLVEIVQAYVRECEFEQNATSVAEAEKRLREIEKAAEPFWRVLDCAGKDIGREAMHHVEGLLNDYFEDRLDLDPPIRLHHLSQIMLTFMEGCDSARRQLEALKRQEPHFKQNTAWRLLFIGPLAGFWEVTLKRGRIKIRKDTDKMKPDVTDPPFVTFVKEVERALPEQFRRKSNSTAAYRDLVSDAVSTWRVSSGGKPTEIDGA
ncbi:hypothetical protein [Microvirga sesbaniae]|uniref:hypothetical protein n=1 Tax=Microvirga sesbaniae TaxID=681392 RepID=UPI0021C6911F|nr:hypothetical protein [Microvirga sp. HBU67692]